MINRNTSLNLDLNRIFDLKGENTNLVADILQPVIEVKRICNILKTTLATNATSSTIYTTPSDKDFYIVCMHLSVIKDITSTSTKTSIYGTIKNGVAQDILVIPSLTLNIQNECKVVNFNNPILMERGTNISLTNSTNVANINASAQIYGYTTETMK
jgi:hypothetical protein